MNRAGKSSKSGTEPAATKHPRTDPNAAGVEAHLGNRTTRALLDSTSKNAGRPLEASVQKKMESAFGEDFDSVRVHTPDSVPRGVEAATSDRHIVFGRGNYAPHTERGRRLLAHELAHVVQQSGGTHSSNGSGHLEHEADHAATAAIAGSRAFASPASTPAVQFKIKPEDVASEMIGKTFEVTSAFTSGAISLSSGDHVKIDAWDVDAIHSVRVTVLTGKSVGQSLVVPQKILQPLRTSVAGTAPYSAGVATEAQAVDKAETKLAAFQATKSAFKSPKALARFQKEEHRQEDLLTKRRAELNRREIQEAMFNRFDSIIVREVAAANSAHHFTGANALDPNLVKAQIFQESEMGTAGQHMSIPPTHPVKTRFNLGQVIDSSAAALLTLMEKENNALIVKYKLGNLRSDRATAETEKRKLEKKAKKKKLNATEQAQLDDLKAKSTQNWEAFIWGYVAPGQTKGFADAVNDLFGSGGATPKNLDYEFWIHLAVMWLFEKKKFGSSWEDAVRAYNGSGQKADDYKAAVVKRAADAAASQASGTEFIPTR
jgi:hypothetical protein